MITFNTVLKEFFESKANLKQKIVEYNSYQIYLKNYFST